MIVMWTVMTIIALIWFGPQMLVTLLLIAWHKMRRPT